MKQPKFDPKKPCAWCNPCPSSHCDCGPCEDTTCKICPEEWEIVDENGKVVITQKTKPLYCAPGQRIRRK